MRNQRNPRKVGIIVGKGGRRSARAAKGAHRMYVSLPSTAHSTAPPRPILRPTTASLYAVPPPHHYHHRGRGSSAPRVLPGLPSTPPLHRFALPLSEAERPAAPARRAFGTCPPPPLYTRSGTCTCPSVPSSSETLLALCSPPPRVPAGEGRFSTSCFFYLASPLAILVGSGFEWNAAGRRSRCFCSPSRRCGASPSRRHCPSPHGFRSLHLHLHGLSSSSPSCEMPHTSSLACFRD